MDRLRNDKVDQLTSRDLFLHGRRIRNASPSAKSDDYVIQKELTDLQVSLEKKIQSSIAGVDTGVQRFYSLIKNGTLAIESNCTNNILIVETKNPRNSTLFIKATVKNAPVDDDIILDIYQNSTIWYPNLTILDGGVSVVGNNSLATGVLTYGNSWRVDITNVGSTFPGSDLVITIGI